mmetsp:Transcript_7388/g.11823  ORF Transcript_7388/g.11823 Transcript_7388/m.11823 type:complete len:504 (+) Transcript_7388:63-1574(+)
MSALKQKLPKSLPSTLTSWINGKYAAQAAVTEQAGLRPLVFTATGQQVADWQACPTADVDQAVEIASEAQKEWAKWAPTDRGRVLRKAADILTERNDELAVVEAIDTSRPLQETNCVDIVSARDAFEYYGGLAPTIGGEYISMPGQSFATTRREPLGVTCGIGAWNYPIQSAAWKAAPALACGNSIVYKPSEDTPMTALLLGEVLKDAGLPDGLYNCVLGDREVGQHLTRHEDIRKISFTGDVNTGKAICKDAAPTLKRVQMELGGKSPLIIFEDADINEAVSGAMIANWYSNGQVCSNGTRVFVHSSIKEKFVAELVRRTALLKCGDPLDESTQVSSLVSLTHMNKVLEYVKIGQEDGAKLICGGERVVVAPGFEEGACVTPAIFTDCQDNMRIVKEEVFGPLACILSFDTEEEVIARANDTEYGLSGGVFTKDIQRAHRVMRDINCGTAWINNYNLAPAELPWCGHKHSGIGVSNGVMGIDDWTQVKSVYVEMDRIDCPYE